MKTFPLLLILAVLSAGCTSIPRRSSADFGANLRYATASSSIALGTDPEYAVVEVTDSFSDSRGKEAAWRESHQMALHVLDSVAHYEIEKRGGEKGCPSSPSRFFSVIHVLSSNLTQSSEETQQTLVVAYGVRRGEWERWLSAWVLLCVHD